MAADFVLTRYRSLSRYRSWNLTEFIAQVFQVEVDRAEVEAGRRECAELLRLIQR